MKKFLSTYTKLNTDMPEFDSDPIRRVMRANVESMAISIEEVLPLLRKGNRPHLVGVGSSAAHVAITRGQAYEASVAAVAYLLDTLRLTLFKENIAVSPVCPGIVKTPLTDRNEFPMPFRFSIEQTSMCIRKRIARRKTEIHFPKRFTFILKLLAFLPRYCAAGWLRE